MNSMKLRLILMGCILTIIGAMLLILKSFSTPLAGILIVGLVLAAVGFLWKPRRNSDSIRKDSD